MSFDSNDRTIYDLLNDKTFIVNPNQRKYVWNENNWRELLDDIDLVYSHSVDKHFIGSVILKKEKSKSGIKNSYSIIDGQQRISTLTILISVIAYLFAENNEKDEFYGLSKHLFVTDNRNKAYPILSEKANRDIVSIVNRICNSAEKHFNQGDQLLGINDITSLSKSSKLVGSCFKFFYSELVNRKREKKYKISKLRDIIFDISYIEIVAKEDEDAYSIFEVLNARGLPLSDFDLLRNFLLKYTAKTNKTRIKKKINELESLLGNDTEKFLKHYVMHKYGAETNKDDNRAYKIIANREKGNINNLLDDLLLKARYYAKMTTYKGCSYVEVRVFSFFKPRRQQLFRPLVMGMMHQKDLNNMTDEIYEEYLEYLFEFFICFHVIGEQTSNKIDDIVHGYSYKLENSFDEHLLSEFRASMANRIPSQADFKNSIKRIRYSNKHKAYSGSIKKNNVIVIYELIERELGYEGSFDNMNVEHCNPDAVSTDNSHIGNLMLIEESINKKCKGKDLLDKINEYGHSELLYPKIVMNRFNEDGKLDYEENAEFIAELLYNRIKRVAQQ